MVETILKERDTCYACVVRCKRVVEIKEGAYQSGPAIWWTEYETLGTFGSYCGIDDLAAIAQANQICNEYGVDTIACGATIAFAMECFEKGIITKEQTGGLELKFGDADAMLKVLGCRSSIAKVRLAKCLARAPSAPRKSGAMAQMNASSRSKARRPRRTCRKPSAVSG